MGASSEIEDRIVESNTHTFAKLAPIYDRFHQEIFNPVEQKRLIRVLTDISQRIQNNNHNALDYGCGTGNASRVLLGLGYRVTAVDISPEMLTMLSRKLRSYIRTNQLKLIHASSPDSIAGEFSLVVMYSVLHHLPNPIRYLDIMSGLVKPGGAIMIDHESRKIQKRNRLYKVYRFSNSFLRQFATFPHKSPIQDFRLTDYWDERLPWRQIDSMLVRRGFAISESAYLSHRTALPNPLYFLMRGILTDTVVRIFYRPLETVHS